MPQSQRGCGFLFLWDSTFESMAKPGLVIGFCHKSQSPLPCLTKEPLVPRKIPRAFFSYSAVRDLPSHAVPDERQAGSFSYGCHIQIYLSTFGLPNILTGLLDGIWIFPVLSNNDHIRHRHEEARNSPSPLQKERCQDILDCGKGAVFYVALQ